MTALQAWRRWGLPLAEVAAAQTSSGGWQVERMQESSGLCGTPAAYQDILGWVEGQALPFGRLSPFRKGEAEEGASLAQPLCGSWSKALEPDTSG